MGQSRILYDAYLTLKGNPTTWSSLSEVQKRIIENYIRVRREEEREEGKQ